VTLETVAVGALNICLVVQSFASSLSGFNVFHPNFAASILSAAARELMSYMG